MKKGMKRIGTFTTILSLLLLFTIANITPVFAVQAGDWCIEGTKGCDDEGNALRCSPSGTFYVYGLCDNGCMRGTCYSSWQGLIGRHATTITGFAVLGWGFAIFSFLKKPSKKAKKRV